MRYLELIFTNGYQPPLVYSNNGFHLFSDLIDLANEDNVIALPTLMHLEALWWLSHFR